MSNAIITIAGWRGSGKSTVAAKLILKQPRLIVLDPNEDDAYAAIPNTCYSLDELQDFFAWTASAIREKFAVRYVPDEEESDAYESLNEFCMLAWQSGDLWVVIEELSQFVANPAPAAMPPALRRVVNRGRHSALSLVVTGLRYAEISRPVTAGSDYHVIFATAEPGDLASLRERIGAEATEAVLSLGEHEAVLFETRIRKWRVINSREAWFR